MMALWYAKKIERVELRLPAQNNIPFFVEKIQIPPPICAPLHRAEVKDIGNPPTLTYMTIVMLSQKMPGCIKCSLGISLFQLLNSGYIADQI
jgi:hypothetical protein